MKTADGFMLCNIKGTNYLLPVGQNIAHFKKGLQLTDTGALLWNAIKKGMQRKDLLPYLANYYGNEQSNILSLQADINSFLQQLMDHQLIEEAAKPSEPSFYLKLGNHVIGYHGPKHLLHPSLFDFECNADTVGQHWIIALRAPDAYPLGELILRTREIEILKNCEEYIITLSSSAPVIQIRITLDGVNARFYCMPPYDNTCIEPLFHAFRHAFLIFAQKQGLFALHSSSVLYQNKVWLFSAPSGTGKSTQADYWKNLFNIRILNGDLNLIQFQSSAPVVSGLPWCGTSQIYNNETFALGGIVLLKQHKNNIILELNKAEQALSVMQRLISPAWTQEMLTTNLEFTSRLADQIPVFRFLCKNEPAAAYALREYIQPFYYWEPDTSLKIEQV